MITKKGLGLAVLAVFAFGIPNAMSCTSTPPQPPSWVADAGVVELYPCGPKYHMYWIIFHNFSTTPTPSGAFCGCALNVGGPIVSIVGAKLVDPNTGLPCDGFDFCTHPGVSNSASSITGQGNFGGFMAKISRQIPGGSVCDLWICVLCKPGTTFDQLANWVGQSGVVVVGETNANGVFNKPDHFQAEKLGVAEPAYISISDKPNANSLPGLGAVGKTERGN